MNPQNPTNTTLNTAPKTTPKDFFLHLGAVIALYISVIALLNLIFSIINYLAPDQLSNYFSSSSIAWPISMLIILVPFLYVFERFIIKDIHTHPEKKEMWIQRWRIYLTLFLTGAAIVVDLIALINVYLNGEIGARFIWKVLAVLVVSGTVFKYYFFNINERWKYSAMIRKGHAWFGIILVLATIVGGFLIVGSPAKQRALRFDNQRVSDLQSIQWQIVNYWQQKGKLPASLSDLKDSISGTSIPIDPENKSEYLYAIKGTKSFELCATFSLRTENNMDNGRYDSPLAYPVYPLGKMDDNWKHEAGQACFTRTIDPELYPPNPKLTKPL